MVRICNIWGKVPEAYKGVVLFLVCLLGSNLLWELTIEGDETGSGIVLFCGSDISWVFYDAKLWFAEKTHVGLNVFGVYTQLLMDDISYANGHGCKIIAGCTAIKQLYMMTVILLFSRGRFIPKSLYLLISMIVMIGYNVFRLMVLTYVVRDHWEWFEFMHIHVLKYVFYGLMFLLWVFWDEWMRKIMEKRKAD